MRPHEESALHCDRHGWHPQLAEVLDRLQALTGVRADCVYRELLVEQAQAEEAPGHLFGPLPPALQLLRRLEAEELATAYRMPE